MANRVEIEIGAKDLTGPGFDSAARRASGLKGILAEIQTPLGNVAKLGEQARTAFVSFGGALAVDKWRAWHAEIQKTIGDMAAQADAVGLTTDQLQAYQAAARSAGTNVEGLQQMLGRANVVIGQAAAGDEAAAEAFRTLGVRIFDASGKVRDHTAILTETSRALLGVDDVTQRAALSTVLFARAGSQTTPILREIAQGMAQLDYNAKAAGQTVSGETIEIFRKLNDQSDEASIRIRNLYAEIAAPIQLKVLQEANGLIARLGENAKASGLSMSALAVLLTNPFTAVPTLSVLGGSTGEQALQGKIDAARSQIQDLEAVQALGKTDRDRDRMAVAIGKAKSELATLEASLAKLEAGTARGASAGGVQDNAPDILPNTTGRFAVGKPTGGSGGEKRDRIGEEIAKLSAETQAAESGLRILNSVRPGTILAELERAADLEKKIGEIAAASGKYRPSDERIAQLRVEAAAAEGARQAYERRKQILELADATEAKYGNGQRQLRDTQARLQEAVDTGRLSQEAYNAAMLEAGRLAEDQALKLQGLLGGLEGLAAGMQYAAAQEARQNTVFNMGVQVWQQGGALMRTTLTDLASGAEVNFGKIAMSFAQMLANMALAYAQSQVGRLLFGGAGAGGGGLLGSLFSGGASAGGFASGGGISGGEFGAGFGDFFSGLKFAGGGRPPVGMSSIVGENGPELFMPDRPGTIVPNGKFGLGEGSVSVVQHMQFGANITRADAITWAENIKRETIQAVFDERRRGGPMKRAFG